MFEMLHPADQIVTLMNRIYDHNMTTALGVNLSVRDAQGTVWISPGGVDKGNIVADEAAWIGEVRFYRPELTKSQTAPITKG